MENSELLTINKILIIPKSCPMKPYPDKISIKSWAEEDRPREKLSAQGRRALTDAELIAILIGSGSRTESAVELSKRILHHYDNELNKLAKASVSELSAFGRIGKAKAISIIAALEIGRRRSDAETKAIETILTSKDGYNIMRRPWSILTTKNSGSFCLAVRAKCWARN
jgi:DNA repair protein RadC